MPHNIQPLKQILMPIQNIADELAGPPSFAGTVRPEPGDNKKTHPAFSRMSVGYNKQWFYK